MTDDRTRQLSPARGSAAAGAGRGDETFLDAGIVVRDMRTNERFWLHDLLVDEYGPLLGPDIFAIYCSLSCMANKEQYCWPSLSRLARHWGKGRATVVRAVTLLSNLKLIHVQRGINDDGSKANNVYYLLEPLSIEAGLASLVDAYRQSGAGLDEAIERVIALVPQNWEPLRRKHGHLRSRADWSELLESAFIHDPERNSAPGDSERSVAEPGSSRAEPGSTGAELGSINRNPGGFASDPGRSAGDQASTTPIPSAFTPGLGCASEETNLVPRQDPKDLPTKEVPEKASQKGTHQQGPGGVVLTTDQEILTYELADDEVFIETEEGSAAVARMVDLARHDVEATAHNWGLTVATEAYYSARQFLGQGEDGWTPDEEAKRSHHAALRRELEGNVSAFGAFSLAEALGRHFTNDLVERYLSTSADEERRVRGWLAYVHGEAGMGIENVPGFLRTRIEGGQWPPRTQARRREKQ